MGVHFEALDEGVLLVPLVPSYTQVGFNLVSVKVWKSISFVLTPRMMPFIAHPLDLEKVLTMARFHLYIPLYILGVERAKLNENIFVYVTQLNCWELSSIPISPKCTGMYKHP